MTDDCTELTFLATDEPPARDYDAYIASLCPAKRQGLQNLLHKTLPRWLPLKGSPQVQASESEADVLLFGGAAGGGKTDLAIGLALTKHLRTLYIRKESTQLTAVVDRIAEILGTRKGFNGQNKIWRIPKETRQIQLGGVNNLGDETAYQGNPRDLLVLDEAANIPESQVLFLMGWVRSTVPGQRCRTFMCSNPPTSAEGMWIISYFAPWLDADYAGTPAKPGELRWFAMVDGKDTELDSGEPFTHNDELVTPQSRTFIPSRITDNPFLSGTGYMATLQSLPEPLRSQMLYGDFLAGLEDDSWQVIPTSWVQAAMDRWSESHPSQADGMVSMGVDPSRGGRDESVISTRCGNWYSRLVRMKGISVPDGPTLGAQVILHRRDAAPVHVDAIGVGASVVDYLNDQPIQTIPVTGSEKSTELDAATHRLGFRNLRSQLYWQFREALDPNGKNARNPLCLPPDSQLKQDLCAPTYKLLEGGRIAVEPKPDIFKRIGRSTDSGDAVIYCSMSTRKRQPIHPMHHKRQSHAKRSIGSTRANINKV
ncbi:MAG: terminase [Gammaproteobacteria bacterium]|nr:MAG: terminase [Gammaproteobacteria bacterium]